MATKIKNGQPAGLLRRIGAMVYDTLLLTAILMLAAIPPVMLNGGALRDGTSLETVKNLLFLLYLLAVAFTFYAWHWTHGGQTLGMTTWKIRVTSLEGKPLDLKQSFIRFCTALLGAANLWSPFDPQRQGWHERLSKTQTVVYLPQKKPVSE